MVKYNVNMFSYLFDTDWDNDDLDIFVKISVNTGNARFVLPTICFTRDMSPDVLNIGNGDVYIAVYDEDITVSISRGYMGSLYLKKEIYLEPYKQMLKDIHRDIIEALESHQQ